MLLVKTTIGPSSIHGIGLFAAEEITAGRKVWEFTPGFDLVLDERRLGSLSEACRARVLEYAYYSARRMRYVLCSDDARFINHSDGPNTEDVGFDGDEEGETFAVRDIRPGEEITSNYHLFEDASRMQVMLAARSLRAKD